MGNKIVVYKEPGVVEVEDHDVAEAGGTGRRGQGEGDEPEGRARGDPAHRRRRTSAVPTSTWSAAAPPPRRARRSATRSPGRSSRRASDVQFLEVGDICSVPFNIACGRCRNCREGQTGVCLNVNPARAGSAYGYVDMGGWEGGQAEYVMVPFADFNLLKFPDRDQALEKILDLTMLSDIFPTGYHGAYTRGRDHRLDRLRRRRRTRSGSPRRTPRSCSAPPSSSSGTSTRERLAQARSFGCETVDISAGRHAGGPDRGDPRRPTRWTARSTRSGSRPPGTARTRASRPAAVLNDIMSITRAGGRLGIPGLYVTGDPGAAGRGRQAGHAQGPARAGLGEEPLVHHRPVPGAAVQPRADDEHPARQGAHRRSGQRHRDPARRRPAGLPGLRPGRGAASTCSTRNGLIPAA